ncbi:MAG TPA: hypothetical protein VKG25_13815 [Bryobacteraceae bacterium]|nr:hypothetical protein [Bryobacteraceae bacterium]
MKPTLLLCLPVSFLVLTSICLAAQDVSGRYVLQNSMEISSELLLLPNHSFQYVLSAGAVDYYARGSWQVDGNSVVLTTVGAPALPFKFVRSETTKDSGVHVWVKNPNGEPAGDIDVILQQSRGPVQGKTNDQGEAVFQGASAAATILLAVRAYGVQGGPFPVNSAHNTFFFEINGEAITRVPFQNEHLKISGNTLELRFWNWNKKEPMNYQRM